MSRSGSEQSEKESSSSSSEPLMTASLENAERFLAVEGDGGRLGELGRSGSDGRLLGVSAATSSAWIRFGVPGAGLLFRDGRKGRAAAGDTGVLWLEGFFCPLNRSRTGVLSSSASEPCPGVDGADLKRTFRAEPVARPEGGMFEFVKPEPCFLILEVFERPGVNNRSGATGDGSEGEERSSDSEVKVFKLADAIGGRAGETLEPLDVARSSVIGAEFSSLVKERCLLFRSRFLRCFTSRLCVATSAPLVEEPSAPEADIGDEGDSDGSPPEVWEDVKAGWPFFAGARPLKKLLMSWLPLAAALELLAVLRAMARIESFSCFTYTAAQGVS